MSIFGRSKREAWEDFAREINAEYINGGFWKADRVEAQVDNWKIVLDTYTVSTGKTSVTYTRMRAPFVNLEDFRFKIYRVGIFSSLGKMLGMQDIKTGYNDFDEDFIIKGNKEDLVRQLFLKDKIRQLIRELPQINLEIKDDEGFLAIRFPEGVDELCFQVTGVIKDIQILKGLYELFAEVLRELCIIGVASRSESGVAI